MEYAIIAAGEGSRLVSEGIQCPKPLVSVGGQPLIDRIIGQYNAVGASTVYIVINAGSPALDTHLRSKHYPVAIQLVRQTTPSSLHSFHALLQRYPGIDVCCLATTDTVFLQDEFEQYIQAFTADRSVDALMAVTAYIDDEKPLYVAVDGDWHVQAFLDRPVDGLKYVSGGVYCLRSKALQSIDGLIRNGEARMRNYQRALLAEGLTVKAYPFTKIIDVDHAADIQKAEAFIAGIN